MAGCLNEDSKYKALVDAISFLNSSMKVDEVLIALLVKSVELVQNADTGLIFIFNEVTGCLEVKSSYGFDQAAQAILIRPGESMTGQAYQKNKTIVVNGVSNVQQHMHSISFYTQMGKTADEFLGKPISGIKGVIACPIKIKEQCIGVLVVDNFTNDEDFTEQDVDILEAISIQAALAIVNARILEKTENDRKSLEDYSRIVEAERNKYQYTIQLHNRFTDMVLNGASIRDLVCELSDLIQADIIFMDSFKNISEVSSLSFLLKKDLETIHEQINTSLTRITNRTVRFQSYHARIQPVVVEKINIGWLTIVRNSSKYSMEEEIIIDRAITVLALEILKQRQMHGVDEKYRGDFIDMLITNQNPDMIRRYSNQFRIDFSLPNRLLLIEFLENGNEQPASNISQRVERAISYNCQLVPRLIPDKSGYFITNRLRTLFIIISDSAFPRCEIETLFQNLFTNNQRHLNSDMADVRITAIASEPFIGYQHFGTTYTKTVRILQHLSMMDPEYMWSFYEDCKVKQLLLNNSEKVLNTFLTDTLGPLLSEHKGSRELLNTLKIYIKSNNNWTYTKESLYIHGNTLTQRLKRISQLLDMDFSKYYDLLQIQIALEVLDFYPRP